MKQSFAVIYLDRGSCGDQVPFVLSEHPSADKAIADAGRVSDRIVWVEKWIDTPNGRPTELAAEEVVYGDIPELIGA